jgi:hypothetical protein
MLESNHRNCRKFPTLDRIVSSTRTKKAAHRAAFVHLFGEVISVDFFDHAALAGIDQVGAVFALDVAVFAQRRRFG